MFIVLEIQKQENNVSLLHFEYSDRETAENKYHTILAYAAVSTLPVHAAIMMNEMGMVIRSEYYEHEALETEES